MPQPSVACLSRTTCAIPLDNPPDNPDNPPMPGIPPCAKGPSHMSLQADISAIFATQTAIKHDPVLEGVARLFDNAKLTSDEGEALLGFMLGLSAASRGGVSESDARRFAGAIRAGREAGRVNNPEVPQRADDLAKAQEVYRSEA